MRLLCFAVGSLSLAVSAAYASQHVQSISTGVAEDVDKKIRRIMKTISLCSLFLSLSTLVVVSFVDVVPSRQAVLQCIFYSCVVVFVASLSVSLCMWKRGRQETLPETGK